MTLRGNVTFTIKKKGCNKAFCCGIGPTSLAIAWYSPAGFFFRAYGFYASLTTDVGQQLSASCKWPRIISTTAIAWGVIERGDVAALRVLVIDKTFFPWDATEDGNSVLSYAVLKSKRNIVDFLLSLGSDPYQLNKSGVMSVQAAVDRFLCGSCSESDLPLPKDELLEHQGFSSLHRIVLGIDAGEMQHIDKGDLNATDVNGRTPLNWAAWRGDDDTVDVLLRLGAKVDTADNEGHTPLCKAVIAGHEAVIDLLLQAKASLCHRTVFDQQPPHLAAASLVSGHRLVQQLVDAGADFNVASSLGTPLNCAASHGSLETVQLLSSKTFDLNSTDAYGHTPVMLALLCWKLDAFFHLVRLGARLDLVRKSGENIIHFALWCGSIRVFIAIRDAAVARKLLQIDVKALHDGHDIWHCFDHCRDALYNGVRCIEERAHVQGMIDAIETAQAT